MKALLGVSIHSKLENGFAAQARSTNIAVGGRKMPKRKRVNNSKFLERATAIRKRIKARTGMKFDISALVRESHQRHSSKE